MPVSKISIDCALVYVAHSLINKGSKTVDEFIEATESMGYKWANKGQAEKFWTKAAKKYVKPDGMLEQEFRQTKIELAKQMMDLQKSSFGDWAAGLYRAGLFSSIRTAQASLGGNLVSGIAEEVAQMPVSIFKAITSKSVMPIKTQAAGFKAGFKAAFSKQAVNDVWEILKNGASADELSKFEFSSRLNWSPDSKLLKPVANLGNGFHNLVMNVLTAVDKPARIYHFNKSIMEQSIELALEKGLDPKSEAFAGFIKIAHEHPSEEMIVKAIMAGEEGVFGNSSKVVDKLNFISPLRQSSSPMVRNVGVPAATFFFPVVKFPVNGAMRTIEWAGGGWFYGGVKGKARALTGSALVLAGYKMAENGSATYTITGPYSSKKGLNDVREAGSVDTASIIIDGRNIALKDAPQLAPLVIGAMMYDYFKTSEKATPEGVLLTGTRGVAETVMDLPAVQGYKKFENFITSIKPDERTEGLASNKLFAAAGNTLIPEIFTDLANIGNQFKTGGRSFTDKLEASLGGGPIQFDVFGRPMVRNQVGQWIRWWGHAIDEDPTVKELVRLNVPVSKPTRVIDFEDKARDENEKQYQDRVWYVGTFVKKTLDEQMRDKDFQKASDSDKRAILEKLITKAKKRATDSFESLRIEAREAQIKGLGSNKSNSGPSLFGGG